MRATCQEFATSLLDHARTSHELEIMLNFNGSETETYWEPGERQTLERLKLAIRYKQKKVCGWQIFYTTYNMSSFFSSSLIRMCNNFWRRFGTRAFQVSGAKAWQAR